VTLASDVKLPELSIFAMLVAPYLIYKTPPLSTMEKLVVTRLAAFVAFVALVAFVAFVALVAFVADVAVVAVVADPAVVA